MDYLVSKKSAILALIPARGGSKGVRGKNIRNLGGKPLISWTIEASIDSNCFDHVMVSTDNREIANISQRFGATVPFLRPPELAQDDTPTLPVVSHALNWFELNVDHCNAVILLQPTSPFRTANLIRQAVETFFHKKYDMLLTLKEVEQHPFWMKVIKNGLVTDFMVPDQNLTRRQDLPKVYHTDGSIFIWSRDAIIRRASQPSSGATQFKDENVGTIISSGYHCIEIDTELDFDFAEFIAQKYFQ